MAKKTKKELREQAENGLKDKQSPPEKPPSFSQGSKPKGKQKLKPKGVYLSQYERDKLEEMSQAYGEGWNMHRLIKTAITRFIDDFDEGKIKTVTKTIEKVELE